MFNRVVEIDPKEPQYWKNLINLLIVMTRYDEAEQRLREFESLALLRSATSDYQALQGEIDRIRLEQARSTGQPTGQSGS
jgi:DNA-binding SARP family transcriptional activator